MPAPVRAKEKRTEVFAHLLDNTFLLPGTRIHFGLDPIIGIVPFGDALVTALGTAILLTAKQLHVPSSVLARMAYNLLLNGLIGAIPGFGDVFSFWFKCHSKNAALLVRAVAQGDEGACRMTAKPLHAYDVILVLAIAGPIVLFVGYVSFWLWERGISFF